MDELYIGLTQPKAKNWRLVIIKAYHNLYFIIVLHLIAHKAN